MWNYNNQWQITKLIYLVLSCLVLSCLVLSWLYLVFPCRVMFCLSLSCLEHLILSYLVLVSCRVASCRVVSCRVLFCLALSCLVFSCNCLSVACHVNVLFVSGKTLTSKQLHSHSHPRVPQWHVLKGSVPTKDEWKSQGITKCPNPHKTTDSTNTAHDNDQCQYQHPDDTSQDHILKWPFRGTLKTQRIPLHFRSSACKTHTHNENNQWKERDSCPVLSCLVLSRLVLSCLV